ncbi:hypothetical protein ACIBSV_23515 [Embleya sp. NPDC050154]|uniref:hypothetical protein n=1 Tax=Embleya sp. NPDC050154 TaxID=3363988 RepID=UPI0037891A91
MSDPRVATLRRADRGLTVALLIVGGLALAFTCVNVTLFAISHGTPWYIAWLLDPMVSLALGAVLLTDGVLGRHGDRPGGSATGLRLFAGLATWAMNVWGSVWPDGSFGVPRNPDAAGIVLHSVPPVLLILLAEAVTVYRRRIADLIRELDQPACDLREQHTDHAPDTVESSVPEALPPGPPDVAPIPAWTPHPGPPSIAPETLPETVSEADVYAVFALLDVPGERVSYRRVMSALGVGYPKAKIALDTARALRGTSAPGSPDAARLSLVPATDEPDWTSGGAS